jgi:hypothetical protein
MDRNMTVMEKVEGNDLSAFDDLDENNFDQTTQQRRDTSEYDF